MKNQDNKQVLNQYKHCRAEFVPEKGKKGLKWADLICRVVILFCYKLCSWCLQLIFLFITTIFLLLFLFIIYYYFIIRCTVLVQILQPCSEIVIFTYM